jgi:hypothetical protein
MSTPLASALWAASALLSASTGAAAMTVPDAQPRGSSSALYDATWASLNTRAFPEWYNQAKFGFKIHWGPYAVPGWGQKYDAQGRQEPVFAQSCLYEYVTLVSLLPFQCIDEDCTHSLFLAASPVRVQSTSLASPVRVQSTSLASPVRAQFTSLASPVRVQSILPARATRVARLSCIVAIAPVLTSFDCIRTCNCTQCSYCLRARVYTHARPHAHRYFYDTPGTPTHEFHQRVYGDAPYSNFGPRFTAELFDPAQWADLFAAAGARCVRAWAKSVGSHMLSLTFTC